MQSINQRGNIMESWKEKIHAKQMKRLQGKPVHTHDCEACTFLSSIDSGIEHKPIADIYVCKKANLPVEIIARVGDSGEDYYSYCDITLMMTNSTLATRVRTELLGQGFLQIHPEGYSEA